VLFVDSHVAPQIRDAGVTGVSFGPVVERQLLIETSLPCVETSRLPTVSCRPNNEESAFAFFGARNEAERISKLLQTTSSITGEGSCSLSL
jgi:hypothetical protein